MLCQCTMSYLTNILQGKQGLSPRSGQEPDGVRKPYLYDTWFPLPDKTREGAASEGD
jgi:hypothetical protein